ncbi:cyclin-like protein, partial [Eremomyces bilateralis CBS 781.70]
MGSGEKSGHPLIDDFFSYLKPQKSPQDVLAEKERQWIYAEEELLRTPSILDGMSLEEERIARFKGTNFITQVGIMLKLSQITISTASALLNRYLMRRSLVAKSDYKPLHHYQIAGICLFIATKIEEQCRNIKEVVIACCRVALKNPNMIVDEQTKDYWRWRDTINLNEDKILDMLCFDVNIESPYRLLFDMLKYYNVAHEKQLRNAAWSFLNDSNLTQASLLFTARTIAAAALYCGAKHCGVDFADDGGGRPWWEVQRVKLRDVRRACNYMADGYDGKVAEAAKQLDPQSKDRWSLYGAMRTPEDG